MGRESSLIIIHGFIHLMGFVKAFQLAVPALVLSQSLIIIYWRDARYGTVADVIIIAGIVVGYGTWSFKTMVKNELKPLVAPAISVKKALTKEMWSGLPPIVQKWLERSNVIGKEIIFRVYLKQIGEMRTTPDGKWMPVKAEQWFKTEKPGEYFPILIFPFKSSSMV